ncbi:MAG TPA: sigma-70 family RNA polymerase sigma factor [Terriglobales bacterium]|nr:sigma-70 family RNA polymerase sigma factor [Terriglobales bacterium]
MAIPIDERLMVEAAQRDPSRFADLYEHNFERVYAFVVRRVHDRAEAEDVTADVFHRALENLGGYQWQGTPFAAWLLRIAANAIADRWRRLSKEPEPTADEFLDSAVDDDTERRTMLAQLVEGLPEDQRLVVMRRFVDQRSIKDIAAELGRSEGAIKQLQFRALENLRAKMRSTYD